MFIGWWVIIEILLMCGRVIWILNKFIMIGVIIVNIKWVYNDGIMKVLSIDFILVINFLCKSFFCSVNFNISLYLNISFIK